MQNDPVLTSSPALTAPVVREATKPVPIAEAASTPEAAERLVAAFHGLDNSAEAVTGEPSLEQAVEKCANDIACFFVGNDDVSLDEGREKARTILRRHLTPGSALGAARDTEGDR